MLVFCLGTAAELIKCYPVMVRAAEQGIPWLVVSTGQSPNLLRMQFDDFGLGEMGDYVALIDTKEDLAHFGHAMRWFARLTSLSKKRILERLGPWRKKLTSSVWIVHGDTLSTLGGALLGRRLGLPVAHIEAGLRSGAIWSPFPEEIDRRCVSKIARIHFAPNPNAVRMLINENTKGEVIETNGNTQLDALAMVVSKARGAPMQEGVYAIANLHRFENLNRANNWKILVDSVVQAATRTKVLFVMHPQTEAKVASDKQARLRLESAGVVLLPRQPFIAFAEILAHASFLLSDSAGNQDECRALGLPALILRDRTESVTGLAPDGPCLLSHLDPSVIEKFLANPEAYRRPPDPALISPSSQIIDSLVRVLEQKDAAVAKRFNLQPSL